MLRDGTDWPARWFAEDTVPRLVVRRDLTVLAANRFALALLDGAAAISVKDGTLAGRDRRCATELSAAVASAAVARRMSIVGAGSRGALAVDAMALGGAEGPVALTVRDLDGPVEIECADLETVFGVTPGEHQVIVQLVKGYSSREIAEQFGKSILTVRTHVKRAYGKMGVKTRGQLFAKLLPFLSIR